PPWPGKSVSDEFAPLLFSCAFFDKAGQPIQGPARTMLDTDAMLTLSSGMVETLAPAKSLVMLLRPLTLHDSLAQLLTAGDYKVRVHYHGPSAGVLQALKSTWPEKSLSSVWTGDVASGEASFFAGEGGGKRPELVWGEEVKGLRAAVEFRSGSRT